MTFKAAARLFDPVICLALATIFFCSAESSFGQTDQAPTTPRPSMPTPPPGGDTNADAAGRLRDDETITGKSDKGRSIKEDVIVIDAATRQKQREREMAQHDRTFDASILDVGVDSIKLGKPKARATAVPSANPIASASPVAKPNVTPAPSHDLGAGTSLSLEVVPLPSSPQPSPAPSATASPHN